MNTLLFTVAWLAFALTMLSVPTGLRVLMLNIQLNRLDKKMTLNKNAEGRERGEKMTNSLHYWEIVLEVAVLLAFTGCAILIFAHKFYGWPWN